MFKKYLESTEIIDWESEAVKDLAKSIAMKSDNKIEIAKSCFEWVRDKIKHSNDYKLNPVTCRASDVLKHGTGFCYAKSHLLAALLRANGIPAGLCYQRLTVDGDKPLYCLHGLNAVWLKEFGWYRIDARGNKEGIDAQFSPPLERLAFEIRSEGEADLPEIWPSPLPLVVEALRTFDTYDKLADNLPDVEVIY